MYFYFFFLFFADFQMILVWEERPLRKKEFATNQKNARVKVKKISKRVFDFVTFPKNKCKIVHKMDPELQYVKVNF